MAQIELFGRGRRCNWTEEGFLNPRSPSWKSQSCTRPDAGMLDDAFQSFSSRSSRSAYGCRGHIAFPSKLSARQPAYFYELP